MGEVIQFRGRLLAAGHRGRILVDLWITDERAPERTRWNVQRDIQRAAGFRALKGFTDVRARNGSRHRFSCAPERLNAMIARFEPNITAGRIKVEVAGKRVRARLTRRTRAT